MSRQRLEGRTLGDFVVREKIGEGGFGAVYRAEQPLLAREAVIKVLHSEHRGSDVAVERFLREARLASRLDHPYAAHTYAFGVEPDGTRWIAMELVRGTPLDKLLRTQGPLPLERFLPLLERICEVVHSAHERDIVHRDLKPANVVVLSRSGRLLPKLLDFGIAKLVEGEPEEPAVEPDAELVAMGGQPEPAAASNVMLTRRGVVVGSPPYMAPEQWVDAAGVDARTDLYALAALTYEVLTGRLAFEGPSVKAIARAHAQAPVPSLGAGFPAALDEVLARALAKRPADRYATALDFFAAVRAAAGFEQAPATLPQLAADVREAIVSAAPRPLAESMIALEASRNTHQASEALRLLVDVAIHWIGIVALACRAKNAIAEGGSALADAVRALRRRTLDSEEWLALARELCRPFLNRREACPVPELVSLFFVEGSDRPSAASTAIDELLELRRSSGRAAAHEDLARARLEHALPLVERVLAGLAFLADYQLVVPRAGCAESWMGARRAHPLAIVTRGRPLPDDQPTLVDRDGCAVLSLHPFAAVSAPAPGSPRELFLLSGKGPRGARFLALPSGFERQDDAAWDVLRSEALRDSLELPASAVTDGHAPYRGLSPFGADDAEFFFGREREAEAVANRLRAQAFVAVVGPSGAGKSSFVHAGILPALGPAYRAISVRPGSTPLFTLAARVRDPDGESAELLRDRLAAHPAELAVQLRALAARHGATIVLVIDQFEELFTLCADAEERSAFAEALVVATRAPDEPIRVVLTLRDDFLMRAEQVVALRERLSQGLVLVGTPAADDLRRIVAEPARRAGFEFEDDALPGEMAAAVAGQAGALALLSFTAARLWEARDRQFRQLTRKAYDALGGVGGALAKHADATLQQLAHDDQRLVREAFRHLVTSQGTRAVVARAELVHVLGGGAAATGVIERLVAARLLVASDDPHGGDRVEVIHEALLSAWPRLVSWRQEDEEGARLRDQLRAAARQWEERGRPKGVLWRADALAEYRLWRARYPGILTASEEQFAAASLRDAARGRVIRRWLAGGAIASLTIGLAVLFRLNAGTQVQRGRAEAALHVAEDRAHESQGRLVDLYQEQGRQALLDGRAPQALVYLTEAYRLGADGPALHLMLAMAARSTDAERVRLVGHHGRLWSARFSRDGKLALTASADGTARLWDATTGSEVTSLRGHTGDVRLAVFSPDGERVATASYDGTGAIWDRRTGRRVLVLAAHKAAVTSIDFDRDGARLVTGSADGTALVWDAARGVVTATLVGHEAPINGAEFSPDGTRVVTASDDGTARLWRAADGRALATLAGHTAQVLDAEFSPDGARIATASKDRSVRVWGGDDGRLLATLVGHTDEVSTVHFDPTGKLLVSASTDRTARVWDATSGAMLVALAQHTGFVDDATFDPSGRLVATAGGDGSAKLWDARTGALLESFESDTSAIKTVSFSNDGTRLLTASIDGTARIWDTSGPFLITVLAGHTRAARRATFAADGAEILSLGHDGAAKIWTRDGRLLRTLEGGTPLFTGGFDPQGVRVVTAGQDGSARLWEARTGRLIAELRADAGPAQSVSFSPDGQHVAIGSVDGTARIWDAATGRLERVLRAHTDAVQRVVFSPDGKTLATASADKTARLWSAADGRELARLDGHTAALTDVAFSPDGTRVATASEDETARLWDVRDGKPLATLSGHTAMIYRVAFSPDGARLATASQDGTAKIWDGRTGAFSGSLDGHAYHVRSVAFSPDSALVLTTSADKTAKVWDARTFREVASMSQSDIVLSGEFSPDGRLVVTAAWDGSVRIWDLRQDTRSVAELVDMVACAVPFRLSNGTLSPVLTRVLACKK